MEFCESGSLHDTMVSFGAFPETLVCAYLRQVLLGLEYLHGQGIVHRDIKSGNILCTKDGIIKLADFGIATAQGNTKEVFEGSPYWVAPEVIELSGSSTASDIWSVGCTAIELFTTKPPYFELEPVSALFRIATDPNIPYPEGISVTFKSFLDECFQRDKNLRIDASRLLRHSWILGECKTRDRIVEGFENITGRPPNLNAYMDSVSSNYSEDFEDIQGETALQLSSRRLDDKCDLPEFDNFTVNTIQKPSLNKKVHEIVSVTSLVAFLDICLEVEPGNLGATFQQLPHIIVVEIIERFRYSATGSSGKDKVYCCDHRDVDRLSYSFLSFRKTHLGTTRSR
jgi:serine/threonine protein kinase